MDGAQPTIWTDSEVFAALVGAVFGMLATWAAMRFARATERKKLTLEVIVEKIWDKDYIQCIQRLGKFRRFIEAADLDAFLNNAQPKVAAIGTTEVETKPSVASGEPATDAKSTITLMSTEETPFETPRDVVRSILNFYEILAIGIRDQILDETICKRYMHGELLQNWRSCKLIVERLRVRANNDRIYCEVENLAKQWARSPPKPEHAIQMFLRGWY